MYTESQKKSTCRIFSWWVWPSHFNWKVLQQQWHSSIVPIDIAIYRKVRSTANIRTSRLSAYKENLELSAHSGLGLSSIHLRSNLPLFRCTQRSVGVKARGIPVTHPQISTGRRKIGMTTPPDIADLQQSLSWGILWNKRLNIILLCSSLISCKEVTVIRRLSPLYHLTSDD